MRLYDFPSLILRDFAIDMSDGCLNPKRRHTQVINILQADGRRPGLGARPLPRLLRLEVAAQLAQTRINVYRPTALRTFSIVGAAAARAFFAPS